MEVKAAVSLCCGDCNAIVSSNPHTCFLTSEVVEDHLVSEKGFPRSCPLPSLSQEIIRAKQMYARGL